MNTKQKKHTQTPKQKPEQKPTPTRKPKHTKYKIVKATTDTTGTPKLGDSIWVFI